MFTNALATWSFHHFEPAVMRERSPLEEVRTLGPRGEGLAALLYRLRKTDPAAFEAFHRTLRMVLPAVDSVSVEVASDGRIELTVIEAGVKFSQRVISDGTLRIIGMLAIIHTPEPPMLLGFEEPENGVTPHQLSLIAELFQGMAARGTQVILTTHSPFLPEYFDPGSLIVVRRGPAGTTLDPLMKLDALGRRQEVEQTLLFGEDATPLSERMLRGDFDG